MVADLCADAPARHTPWWVLTLVGELPDTSAYAASLGGGPEYRGWGFERHLLAAMFDAVQIQTVVFAKAFGAKSAKPPKPIKRPGDSAASGGTPMRSLMRLHAKSARAAQLRPDRADRGE